MSGYVGAVKRGDEIDGCTFVGTLEAGEILAATAKDLATSYGNSVLMLDGLGLLLVVHDEKVANCHVDRGGEIVFELDGYRVTVEPVDRYSRSPYELVDSSQSDRASRHAL